MTLIFTDRHHHALMESLLLLFEDRAILGPTEVYFPYGMGFFEKGIWNFERQWHGDTVARQYLLGVWGDPQIASGCALSPDPKQPKRTVKGVTLDAALATDWDFVISSLPHNYDGYYRLAQETGAKYGIQIGNEAQPFDPRADFCLSSSTLPGYGPEWIGKVFDFMGVPTLMYHQEFDLETFRPEWPPATSGIGSFIQCFAENTIPYAEFLSLARAAPDLDWRVYGAYGSHPVDEFAAGDINTTDEIADAMRAARVVWHSKSWSDGFGHVIHNAFAIGRPVVGRASYYTNRLAGPLWVEGVTSFDIDRRAPAEILALLRKLRDDDDYHHKISTAAAARFREIVSFDEEAQAIKGLLS